MPNLKIDDKNYLHYQLLDGDKSKPYLVFLHEGLGCVDLWKGFPERLCKTTGCPGLVYDRLGYGKSSPLNHRYTIHFMHEHALNTLPLLLEAVIPNTSFILIGHSDGGSICLIFGAERPALLKGIITEAAHVFVESETVAGIKDADDAWKQGNLKGMFKYHGDKTEIIFKAWSEIWLTSSFKHWNIEYLLPSIDVPLLVIQGRDDQFGTVEQVNSITSKFGGTVHSKIIDNCAHSQHLEAEKEVLSFMREFLSQVIQG